MKILRILLYLLFLISNAASADVDETGKITRMIIEGNSMVSVWLDGPDVTNECDNGSRWTLSSSDLLFKEKLSLLLSASSQNKSVHLHHLTPWGCGNWSSNKIYYIDVKY